MVTPPYTMMCHASLIVSTCIVIWTNHAYTSLAHAAQRIALAPVSLVAVFALDNGCPDAINLASSISFSPLESLCKFNTVTQRDANQLPNNAQSGPRPASPLSLEASAINSADNSYLILCCYLKPRR
jgi:hypothetical protein